MRVGSTFNPLDPTTQPEKTEDGHYGSNHLTIALSTVIPVCVIVVFVVAVRVVYVKNQLRKNKTENVPERTRHDFPRQPVYRSQQTPSYLVPFSALPPNFDFSLPNIEVHSDFVIIKDLDILQTYWYVNEGSKEEYQRQFPTNPAFSK